MFPNFHNTTRDSIWNRVFPISWQNHNSDAWNRNSRIIPGTRSDQHRKHARPNLNFSLFSECKEVEREKVLGKVCGHDAQDKRNKFQQFQKFIDLVKGSNNRRFTLHFLFCVDFATVNHLSTFHAKNLWSTNRLLRFVSTMYLKFC